MIVLDASAVLAYLFREAGHEDVAAEIDDACLSTVNLSEVLARFARDGHDPRVVLDGFRASPIKIVDFDDVQAELAAGFVPRTAGAGLSLGDRACLALALSRGMPALTADRAWAGLDTGVEIRLLR